MSYGLRYQTQFKSVSDSNNAEALFTLQFLFKNYSGNSTRITGGQVTAIQKCTSDDPFEPIKGQSLDIRLVNDGAIPITSFQHEDDDGVQVILLDENDAVLFIGYLVQDDFYEMSVDYEHEITLSATDSLGLLKSVPFSDASVKRGFSATYRTNGVNNTVYIKVDDTSFYPQFDDTINLGGMDYFVQTAVEENNTISAVVYNWKITINPTSSGIAQTTGLIYLTGKLNLQKRNSLLSIIASCIAQTNLSIYTNIYLNLIEANQDITSSTFDQTLIDTQRFISGDTYEDCYSVLSKVLETFRCSLFQAGGRWNIVCWGEGKRYSNNNMPGWMYDETFLLIGQTSLYRNFNIGATPRLTRWMAGLTQGAVRGYKFVRKQFDYNQPKYILRNFDLQDLGALLRTYQSGAYYYSEYVAPGWAASFGTPASTRFIRVIRDGAGTEFERYLVVTGPTFDSARSVQGEPFEVSAGDKVKFSFSVRTNISQSTGGSAIIVVFALRLTNGTNNWYIDELPAGNGEWKLSGSPQFTYVYNSGDNTNVWHNVEMPTQQTPSGGLVYCYLGDISQFAALGKESHYKDIRLEYNPYVNDTSKIKGHVHTQTQDVNKKNNLDKNIYIDDSPRNSVIGTLFRKTKTGVLQDKTALWKYPGGTSYRLAEWSTREELTWRQKTRQKYEGSFVGIKQNGYISLLSWLIMDTDVNKNYVFGLLSIDYKNNQFGGTLWEIHDVTDADLDADYEFKYLYSQ